MGHQIIKQPNGKLAIWSSVVDNFVYCNASKSDLIKYYIELETERIERQVNKTINELDNGEKPYGQLTKTFDSAIEFIREVHGEAEADEILKITKQ